MDIKKALQRAKDELKGVQEPQKSAEFLMRQVLHWDKARLIANPDYKLNAKQEKKLHDYVERRKQHEPVWYITGKIEFYEIDLIVNENVLIPRPETEFLVEEVLGIATKKSKILELGTGSGVISLALASKLKTKIYASDISGEALRVAKKNARELKLDKFIELKEGDLFEPWESEKFDIIVANLPYIPHEEVSTLSLDIHHWEPRVALDGGKEGLEIYEALLKKVGDYLNKDAVLFLEIGINQGEGIKGLTKKYLPKAEVRIKKDYGDIDRIAIISNIVNSC